MQFGWKNQCAKAQEDLSDLDRRLNVVKGTLVNHKKQVATVSKDSASKVKAHEQVLQKKRTLEQEIAGLKEQRESAQQGESNQIGTLRQQQRELLGRKAGLEQQINQRDGQLRSLDIPFKAGGQGRVNMAKVHGCAATLFSIKDPEKFVAALDVSQ